MDLGFRSMIRISPFPPGNKRAHSNLLTRDEGTLFPGELVDVAAAAAETVCQGEGRSAWRMEHRVRTTSTE